MYQGNPLIVADHSTSYLLEPFPEQQDPPVFLAQAQDEEQLHLSPHWHLSPWHAEIKNFTRL